MGYKKPFRLRTMPEVKLEDSFRLDTLALEREMLAYNGGIDLSD